MNLFYICQVIFEYDLDFSDILKFLIFNRGVKLVFSGCFLRNNHIQSKDSDERCCTGSAVLRFFFLKLPLLQQIPVAEIRQNSAPLWARGQDAFLVIHRSRD